MKHYRISIDVDITAKDYDEAELRACLFYADMELRHWTVEVLPNGIEERIPIVRKGV